MHISTIILPIISLLPSATAAPLTVDVGLIQSCTIPGLPLLSDYNTVLDNICNQWFPFSINKCAGGPCLVHNNLTSLEVNQTVPTYDSQTATIGFQFWLNGTSLSKDFCTACFAYTWGPETLCDIKNQAVITQKAWMKLNTPGCAVKVYTPSTKS